jgi:hypothetical protein
MAGNLVGLEPWLTFAKKAINITFFFQIFIKSNGELLSFSLVILLPNKQNHLYRKF